DRPSIQVERIAGFYLPLLRRNYENPEPRAADIEHLAALAQRYGTRRQFLTELVLEPPVSTGDLAGPPVKDEDWLVLSTIHSAKGLEWDAVYLIHAADGCLPSDMASGNDVEIEEELRLTYVAMTRARDFLYVLWPLRYYHRPSGLSANHSYAQCCRFLDKDVIATMDCLGPPSQENLAEVPSAEHFRDSILERIKDMWR
ncbi:MAG: ATP-dependent helicase, partial [Chloroflexi bacterium]|nr:ATP-dependent helicase [Chloroflexota bacterium]